MAELQQHYQKSTSKYSEGPIPEPEHAGGERLRRFYVVNAVILAIGFAMALAALVVLYLFQLPLEFVFLPLVGLFLCLPALGYFIGRLKKQ